MKLVKMTSWLRSHSGGLGDALRFERKRYLLSVCFFTFSFLPHIGHSQEVSEPFSSKDESIQAVPVIDLSEDLSQRLEALFQNILLLEEDADAFDSRLGESYMAYGGLLTKAGRLDEARDMYAKSLHLAKINNGVYSLEQRPILSAMFNLHDVEGDLEEMEAAITQILWLERKNPEVSDNYSYDLLLRMGAAFIELYYERPRINEASLAKVQKAIRYLRLAVRNYPDIKLSETQQPYGDLALLHYISGQINRDLGRVYQDQSKIRGFREQETRQVILPTSNFVGRAARALDLYFEKAQAEESVEHMVRALRDKGDLFLLFDRFNDAAYFYEEAWKMADQLEDGHELLQGFEEPAKLPDFNYSGARLSANTSDRTVFVPVNFDLHHNGRVRKVYTKNGTGPYPKLTSRAKRAARATVFRPIIEGGKMVAAKDVTFDIRVRLRNGETLASVGGQASE